MQFKNATCFYLKKKRTFNDDVFMKNASQIRCAEQAIFSL